MDKDSIRELEVGTRRPLTEALHPDACPKLTLHGVDWAIPPRGIRHSVTVSPVFTGGDVTVGVSEREEGANDADADRLMELATITVQEVCETCGRPIESSLEVDTENNTAFLQVAFRLARTLLMTQYTLTDDQLVTLLTFDVADSPQWFADLLDWCRS